MYIPPGILQCTIWSLWKLLELSAKVLPVYITDGGPEI